MLAVTVRDDGVDAASVVCRRSWWFRYMLCRLRHCCLLFGKIFLLLSALGMVYNSFVCHIPFHIPQYPPPRLLRAMYSTPSGLAQSSRATNRLHCFRFHSPSPQLNAANIAENSPSIRRGSTTSKIIICTFVPVGFPGIGRSKRRTHPPRADVWCYICVTKHVIDARVMFPCLRLDGSGERQKMYGTRKVESGDVPCCAATDRTKLSNDMGPGGTIRKIGTQTK